MTVWWKVTDKVTGGEAWPVRCAARSPWALGGATKRKFVPGPGAHKFDEARLEAPATVAGLSS